MRVQQHKLWLEKEGYRPKTVRSSISNLKSLARRCDINDPESVRAEIVRRPASEGTKEKYCWVYERYLRQHRMERVRPKYRRVEKLPHVPAEKDIEQLIGGLSRRLGTIVLFIKETGARKGEMWGVRWSDIDSEKCRVLITCPEKNSRPRAVRVSQRLMGLMCKLPRTSDYVFRRKNNSSPHAIISYFWQKRREVSEKTGNSALMRIDFKSLRHFKASPEYHRTKDILHVKELLGHRALKNTLVYVHLNQFEGEDEFVVKVAKTLKEFTGLLESGFEYVAEYEGFKVLRKRK